jgi:hypothetical protein
MPGSSPGMTAVFVATAHSHTSAFSRLVSPELYWKTVLPRQEGAGNAGCIDAPAALRAKNKMHASKSPQVHRLPRHSLRDGFTVSFVLSPETGLCCLRHQRNAKASRSLDISVGTSGPHDFAVRNRVARRRHNLRPSHPALHGRDDASAPPDEHETHEELAVICPTPQAKSCVQLDRRANRFCGGLHHLV